MLIIRNPFLLLWEGIFLNLKTMKILNVSINKEFPPTKEVLIELCTFVNKDLTQKEIIKAIEKNELYKPIKQSQKGKTTNPASDRDTNSI